MNEAIEKLRAERKKLTVEYKQNQKEYKSEIKRIDKAIRKFKQGYKALGNTSNGEPRKNATAEIEKILAAKNEAMHVKKITAELHNRGFQIALQSVSAALQVNAKAGKRFRKTGPATFALLPPKPGQREIRVIKKGVK
jgi:hypothetical protein